MKHLRTLLVGLVGLITLASCSGDKWTALELSGQWRGDFGMYYEFEHAGRIMRFDSWDTYIRFDQSLFSDHGTGHQVDFYEQGPYRYISYTFRWRVRDGNIILEYPRNPEWNTTIYDYTLRYGYFSGYFGDSNTRFYLRSLTDCNWDDYCHGDIYYDPYSNYGGYFPYYAPSRSDSLATDSLPAPATIRRGSRFEEVQ